MEIQTGAQSQLPAAAVVITHEVEDFSAWKRASTGMRRSARAPASSPRTSTRTPENPNHLSVYLAGSDRGQADGVPRQHRHDGDDA